MAARHDARTSRSRKDEFVPSTLSSVDYEGKLWGVPRVTDAGFLYYRKDKVDEVPATWQEVYEEAKAGNGIVYQGASYEGLTVNFLELAFAAGGKILSEDGKKSVIDSPENLKALQFMVDGIKNGAAPKAVTTYMEEEARRAFEAGRADFERQWPYAYALGNKEGSKVKGKFAVAPYPEFEGGGKAAILGGHNMVISAYSKNPGGALKLIDYLTSEKRMTKNAADFSKAPVLAATYDDPAVKKALPFIDELKQAVEQAKSRPVSPVYSQISQAIYKNVNQRSVGVGGAEGCAGEGAGGHGQGTGHLLGRSQTNGSRLHQGRLAAEGGAPRASRSAASRQLMVSPSLMLIAIVAAYPIGYAVWLSLHEYSVRVAGLSRWAGLRNYSDALQSSEFWDAVQTTFIFTGFSVLLRDAAGAGDGDGDALGVQGPGPAAHRRAGAVGGAHGRHGDHLADDLRAVAGLREQPARRRRPARRHRVAGQSRRTR